MSSTLTATEMKPFTPGLRDGVVYVWEGRLDATPTATTSARTLLSERELARADRFVYDRHRRRYTVAQAHLRRALGRLMGVPPQRIRFSHGKHGKPYLGDGPSFNQSHSGERIMIAVANEGRLGVDIEKVRTVRLMAELAEKQFARDEVALFRATRARGRQAMFFRLWTLKEAFTKALGVGLTIPLSSFSVDPAHSATNGLVRIDGHNEDPAEWLVAGLPCAAGAKAAFAIDRPGITVAPLPFNVGG